VLKWLLFLKYYNHLYKDVQLDANKLKDLPTNAVPAELWDTAKLEKAVDSVNAESDGYVKHVEEKSANNFDANLPHRHSVHTEDDEYVPVSRSGLVDIGKAYSAQDVHDFAVQQTMSISFLPHKEQSLSEFKEQYFLELMFPTLFPYGRGGHDMRLNIPRKGRLDLAAYCKHCLNLWDPRFRLHPHFMFVVCDILQRHQVLIRSSVRARTKTFVQNAEQISKLTGTIVRHTFVLCFSAFCPIMAG